MIEHKDLFHKFLDDEVESREKYIAQSSELDKYRKKLTPKEDTEIKNHVSDAIYRFMEEKLHISREQIDAERA